MTATADFVVQGQPGMTVATATFGGDGLQKKRLVFAHPDDREQFSELICLVREQIEVFVETPKKTRKKKKKDGGHNEGEGKEKTACGGGVSLDLCAKDRVGIRCIHCRGTGKVGGSLRGAVLYPTSTQHVYQAVRNYQRYHMMGCPSLPLSVRDRYFEIKESAWQKRSSNQTGAYWERTCARMGLVNAEDGHLRLRKAVLDGTWTEEMGREAMQRIEVVAAARTKPAKKDMTNGEAAKKTKALVTRSDITSSSPKAIARGMNRVKDNNHTGSKETNHLVDHEKVPGGSFGTIAFHIGAESASQHEDGINDFGDVFDLEQNVPFPAAVLLTGNSIGFSVDPERSVLQSHQPAIQSIEDTDSSRRNFPKPRTQPKRNAINLSEEQVVSNGDLLSSEPQGNNGEASLTTNVILDHVLSAIMNPSNHNDNLAQTPFVQNGLLGYDADMDNLSPVQVPQTSLSDDVACESCLPLIAVTPKKDAIMQGLERASCLVQAAMEIRQLPMSGENHPTNDCVMVDPDELHSLGEELYEIFANRRPFYLGGGPADKKTNDGRYDHEEGLYEREKRTKKGRPPERALGQTFVPLTELGIPSALCWLVSTLLEAKHKNVTTYHGYTSLEEVQEDLQLMMSNPEKFLFLSTSAIESANLQVLNVRKNVLYGREEETSKLLQVFNQLTSPSCTNSRSSMVLIAGYSGTGKSSLVRKVEREFIQRGARFVSGKFDEMQQMEPLSAIMNALNEYCNLLAHDTVRIDRNRAAVATALGSEARVLAALIPNLSRLLPETIGGPPLAEVTGREAHHRLAFLIRLLLRSTCSSSNPIVLFLDDLQWADKSSLELMRSLVADASLDKMLVIGCYRDNEVGPGHPLFDCLDTIRRCGRTSLISICTSNLKMASVNALMSDVLRMLPRATGSLSEAVLQKTGGNALFVTEFLTSLRDEGLLRYSLTHRKWEWEIDSIRSRMIANNVVDLMTAKLLRLAPEVHQALRVASAFGAHCSEEVLQIYDTDPCHYLSSTVAALDIAVAEGLMAKVDGPAYRFSHDQIQSAAYKLIPESERESFHLHVGKSLWQQSSEAEIDEYLFVIVDQLHRGACRISDHKEKIRLAELSLTAGRKAAEMSAFLPASAYLQAGIGLISDGDWEWHRELCFDLYNWCAEIEYILGKFDEVKAHLEEVIKKGRTLREKLRAYYTFVQSSGSFSNTGDAFATALMVLENLGESIPAEVTEFDVQQELLATQALLRTKTEGELLQLKPMSDIDKLEAMRFLNILLLYAYAERKEHFPIMSCRMVQLSLTYGVCKDSAIAFGAYGGSICGLLGDISNAYRFGKIALTLLERFQAKECLPRVFIAVYGFINNWTDPLQSSLPCLKEAINTGLSTGNNDFAMANASYYQDVSLASGKPLGPLVDEMNEYATQMLDLNQNFMYTLNLSLRQFALNLLGKSADPVKLVGKVMDEGSLLDLAEEKGLSSLRCIVYKYRLCLEVFFGEYERAVETAELNRNIDKDHMGRFSSVANHSFYHGLSALVLARRQGRSKWEDIINRTMAQMKKWAMSNPWNCQHKLELMIAEHAYLEGNMDVAIQAYDCAVASAAKHRFVHEEGLALERAGIFYMETGDNPTASRFFHRAHDCYVRWEAHSKAAHVKQHL